jgi:predicted transcriptional regulator
MKYKKSLLISVRPKFAEMIFSGSKTVELRRVRPNVRKGDIAIIYVSSPTRALQGAFEISNVVSAKPVTLWRKCGKQSGIKRAAFLSYFAGKVLGHALVIKRAWKWAVSTSLCFLRRRNNGFHPPQSFRYLKGVKFDTGHRRRTVAKWCAA